MRIGKSTAYGLSAMTTAITRRVFNLRESSNLLIVSAVIVLSLCIAPTMAYAVNDSSTEGVALTTAAAQQSTNSYKVVFKANGGKGTMKVQTIKRGKKTALKANTFKRSGYKFAGWNTKKNGKGKTYKNKAKIKNLAKAGKKVTLYAQWKKTAVLTLKKAKRVYSSALKDLKSKHHIVYYKYVNIIGDNTVELIAYSYPRNEGMQKHDYIYTIESGKPKLVLDSAFSSEVPWCNLAYRKSAKSLVYYYSSEYSDSSYVYRYFKYSGGKYKEIASKRYSKWTDRWYYSVPNGSTGTSISRSVFNKKVKGLIRGKEKTIDVSPKEMTKIMNEANRNSGY